MKATSDDGRRRARASVCARRAVTGASAAQEVARRVKCRLSMTLRPGLVLELSYRVSESRELWSMERLIRWACMEALRRHAMAGQRSVGIDTRILSQRDVPPGLVARVEVQVDEVDGAVVCFRVLAYDGARRIGEGIHERFVLEREPFTLQAAPRPEGEPMEPFAAAVLATPRPPAYSRASRRHKLRGHG
jgi:predicted thioesterase